MFDNKKYCTIDEAIEISDKSISKNAKFFAKMVVDKQGKNTKVNEKQYV
jgi:hypothetical protein